MLADAAPPPPEDNEPVMASFPTAFGGRGQKTKHETQVVSAPRPVYTAPNRPPEAAPKEKKPKRQSIYANQNGGIALCGNHISGASAHERPRRHRKSQKGQAEAVGRPGGAVLANWGLCVLFFTVIQRRLDLFLVSYGR